MRALIAAAWLCAAALPSVSAGAAETPAITAILQLGELPPAPPHTWADAKVDANENRAYGNGLVHLPALRVYLNQLYQNLKESAGVADWPGEVYIVADTTLNAHTSASGNIYLNMGVIQSAETEDEIIGVMAHEFGHVYLNHQAAYEAQFTTSNIAKLGEVLVKVAVNKTAGTTGTWAATDTIALVHSVARDGLIPSWQREVEQQADLFAATLALRNKYSYPSGFKAFLERLAAVEAREQKAAAAAAAAAAPAMANQASAAVVDGAGSAAQGSARTHANARQREEILTEQVLPLLKRPRAVARKAPWQAALKEAPTAEVMAHFALRARIEQLQAANRHNDALALARQGASGATEGDATMVILLADAMKRAGLSPDEQFLVLKRNFKWDERAWSVINQAALMGIANFSQQATEFMEEQYAYLGKPPRAMPDLVAFYLASGSPWTMRATVLKCTLDARYRDACIMRSKTSEQLAQEKAQQAARQQQMESNLQQKMEKMLKVK
jgi:Zn-dependent protease with chaperone function